jgi:hypothetical protein
VKWDLWVSWVSLCPIRMEEQVRILGVTMSLLSLIFLLGLDSVASCIIHHEFSKYDPGFTLAYLAHSLLFVNNFYYASNDDQKERYLAKVPFLSHATHSLTRDFKHMRTNTDHYAHLLVSLKCRLSQGSGLEGWG